MGFDVTRTNPLFIKKSAGRVLLEEGLLRHCSTLARWHDCQPIIHTRVIDSFATYEDWIRSEIRVTGAAANIPALGLLSSSSDEELLSIQTDIVLGNVVLLSRVSCPLVNVTHASAPLLETAFLQQLKLLSEAGSEESLELVEDFGTHYLEEAVLGTSMFVRFTLNRKAVEWLEAKEVSLIEQASWAIKSLISRFNVFPNASSGDPDLGKDLVEMSEMQLYSDVIPYNTTISSSAVDAHWIHSAMSRPTVVSMQLQPIEKLMNQSVVSMRTIQQWQLSNQMFFSRTLLHGLEMNVDNGNDLEKLPREINAMADVFVLPFVTLWANRSSTVTLRTSWNRW